MARKSVFLPFLNLGYNLYMIGQKLPKFPTFFIFGDLIFIGILLYICDKISESIIILLLDINPLI